MYLSPRCCNRLGQGKIFRTCDLDIGVLARNSGDRFAAQQNGGGVVTNSRWSGFKTAKNKIASEPLRCLRSRERMQTQISCFLDAARCTDAMQKIRDLKNRDDGVLMPGHGQDMLDKGREGKGVLRHGSALFPFLRRGHRPRRNHDESPLP